MTEGELQDRVQRGNIRAVLTETPFVQRFDGIRGDYLKIAVGEPHLGWASFDDIRSADTQFSPDSLTSRDDLLLLYGLSKHLRIYPRLFLGGVTSAQKKG